MGLSVKQVDAQIRMTQRDIETLSHRINETSEDNNLTAKERADTVDMLANTRVYLIESLAWLKRERSVAKLRELVRGSF